MLTHSVCIKLFVTVLTEDVVLLLVWVVDFVFASNAQLLGNISLLTFGQIVYRDARNLSLLLTDAFHSPQSGLKLETELA